MKQPRVQAAHPLAELLAKKLFGLGSVPAKEVDKVVYKAIKAAVEWHENAMKDPYSKYREQARQVFEGRGVRPTGLRMYVWSSADVAGSQTLVFVESESLESVTFRGNGITFDLIGS
jgi:hypothetical protein